MASIVARQQDIMLNVAALKPKAAPGVHAGAVTAALVMPTGDRAVTGSVDHSVKVSVCHVALGFWRMHMFFSP